MKTACGKTILTEFYTAEFCLKNTASFLGYTRGELWNSFQCPRFTKEVGLEIADALDGAYDEKIDAFIFPAIPNTSFQEVVFGGPIYINEEQVWVYGIGTWHWSWGLA